MIAAFSTELVPPLFFGGEAAARRIQLGPVEVHVKVFRQSPEYSQGAIQPQKVFSAMHVYRVYCRGVGVKYEERGTSGKQPLTVNQAGAPGSQSGLEFLRRGCGGRQL